MLKVEALHKAYCGEQGRKAVLCGISMEMKQGGLLPVLGRSGSGKTTLLRLIAGYEKPDAGRILFGEEEVKAPSPERFMVFQDYNQLYPWRTVRGNILFSLRVARPEIGKSQRCEIADFWLKETGLLADGDKWPRELSGGMKQRAALARAFALSPKLLLLDEPFAGLDAMLRETMQRLLKEICTRHGISALFVTHDIDEALMLCEEPAVLLPEGTKICEVLACGDMRARVRALL